MKHELVLVINGHRASRIRAMVECSCGVHVPLYAYELAGDVTDEANQAISDHAKRAAIPWQESIK